MGVYLYKYSGTNIYFQAAKKLIDVLSRSLRERKKTLLLLSGGSVIALYPKLAKFTQLKIAQVDERFQPENKDDVNAEAIAKTGFLLPYYKVRQDTTLAEAARGYDNEISKLMEWIGRLCSIGLSTADVCRLNIFYAGEDHWELH